MPRRIKCAPSIPFVVVQERVSHPTTFQVGSGAPTGTWAIADVIHGTQLLIANDESVL
jgi:hypothetical protein